MSDMPTHVHIKEVGPREGFQFEKGGISLSDKISLVDALSDTGVGTIEFTSFVSPKWVPQMADAEELMGFMLGDLRDKLKGVRGAVCPDSKTTRVGANPHGALAGPLPAGAARRRAKTVGATRGHPRNARASGGARRRARRRGDRARAGPARRSRPTTRSSS